MVRPTDTSENPAAPDGQYNYLLVNTGNAKFYTAGVEPGDIITKFDGKAVEKSGDLPRIVAQTPIGKEVEVQVWRGGKEITRKVTLGKLDEAPQKASLETTAPQQDSAASSTVLGLDVAPLNAETRRRFNIKDSIEGVVVLKVDPNSVAAERRVSAGDVIVEVQREAVKSAGDIKKRLDALKAQGIKKGEAVTREYLAKLMRLRFLGPYSGRAFTWVSEALTLGYLPEEFRDKLEWYPSPNQERFFDANNVVLRIASRVTPQAIQVLPFKLLIADVRWRNRTGRPLI